jgi:hypothetical protein
MLSKEEGDIAEGKPKCRLHKVFKSFFLIGEEEEEEGKTGSLAKTREIILCKYQLFLMRLFCLSSLMSALPSSLCHLSLLFISVKILTNKIPKATKGLLRSYSRK